MRIFREICLSLFLILPLWALTACGTKQPASPVTTPTFPGATTSSPTETKPLSEWVADGAIGPVEYAETQIFSQNFTLYWRSDGQYAYFAMRAHTNGWVALGFQPRPENRKKDADFVLAAVTQERTAVVDSYSISGPHYPDTDLGGTNDIIEFAGKEADGNTTIEFKRLLVTGDKYDQPLSISKNKIMWAWGTEDDLDSIHEERGYGEIEIRVSRIKTGSQIGFLW